MSQAISAARAQCTNRTWMKLDNAGKIYPATYSRTQNHVYRLTATLTEEIDTAILQAALAVVTHRFPSIAASLHRGAFWYYLEPVSTPPNVQRDGLSPMTPRSFREMRHCSLRVLVQGSELSLEFFHAVTDGSGALVFLKTLLAEYLEQKYGLCVPCTAGVLSRQQPPQEEELEDCFLRFADCSVRKDAGVKAYRLSGTLQKDHYLTYTTLTYSLSEVAVCAKRYHSTITGFLCAAMMLAILHIQAKKRRPGKQQPIAVTIPVNLRRLHASATLRNFSLYITPNLDPNQGEWTFDEICHRVRCQMGEQITAKEMAARVAANVRIERRWSVRLMPLFLKNMVMKAAYRIRGTEASCLSLSNLGAVELPDAMYHYVTDIQCMLDSHAGAVSSCGVLSFGNALHIKFCRCTVEPDLEYEFYRILRDLGLRASAESNQR